MGDAKHTPGRLVADYRRFSEVRTEAGAVVAKCNRLTSLVNLEANAKRIAACWNACDGIEDPMQLRTQRDELLAALKRAGEALHKLSVYDCGCEPINCACLTGRSAEIELEARMDTADEAAREVSAVLGRINGGAAPAPAAVEDDQDSPFCSECGSANCGGACGGDDLMGASS